MKDEARKIFFYEYEDYMERRFAETKGGMHTTFRRIIKKMVYEVCNAIEIRKTPTFFIMP